MFVSALESDPRRVAAAGSKLFIWWATMLAGSRPVNSRARPIGTAITSSNVVRSGSRWLAAKIAVLSPNAAQRPHFWRSIAPQSSPRKMISSKTGPISQM